jgi:hypothetical protein
VSGQASIRLLLVLKHAGYIDVYEPLVQELADRGHSVHVAYLSSDRVGIATLDRLSTHAHISHGAAPQRSALDGWGPVAWLARALGDLGRFSDPRFAAAAALRERMAAKVESGPFAQARGSSPASRSTAESRSTSAGRRLTSCSSRR